MKLSILCAQGGCMGDIIESMQQDHNQLHETHSPRQQFELKDELGHFQDQPEQHFSFQDGQNPFSYYNDADHHEHPSSEDENHLEHPQHTHINSDTKQHDNNSLNGQHTFQEMEVSPNLTIKPPIQLTSPEKPIVEAAKSQPSVAFAGIKLLKEGEFDLSKLPPPKVEVSPISVTKQQQELQESKYQKELTDDLQGLKNSLKGKDRKKFKIFDSPKEAPSPKAVLNKTFAPASKARQLNQSQLEMEQMRMLVKMAFEKKKANYEMLKEWDRKRAQTMALHGRIIELLQSEIDLRIKSSLENFQNYQIFFQQKARQEEKYVNSPVINTRYALQGNSLSRNVYINCSVILNSLCDQNLTRCRKISDFVLLIRSSILKELTESHLASSQKELLRVREKISTLRAALKKYNQQTEQKTVQLGNLFKEQSGNITNKCEKDFYRTQLSFLRKSHAQIDVQKKLGEYCLEYFHTAVQEELKRSSVIREAMLTYSRGLKATYNLELECTEIEQMSKHEELKLIEEYFSLEEMFDARTLELFKACNQIHGDITIEAFTSYVNGFGNDPFDSRIILLKEFSVKLLSGGKGKQQLEQSCYLVITVDNFLHLTFGQGTYCKPDITIKIAHKGLQVRAGKEEVVDIVKKEEKRNSMMSYFWESKADKLYRIRFAKKDNKEEFMDYITKLMVDNY